MMPVSWNQEDHVDQENNRWRLSRSEWQTSMFFHAQVVSGVQQLVEQQYLASASKQAKHEYAGLSSDERRSIVKAFLQKRTDRSNQGAKTLLGLL
jgi:hypothetical protein